MKLVGKSISIEFSSKEVFQALKERYNLEGTVIFEDMLFDEDNGFVSLRVGLIKMTEQELENGK